MVVNSYVVSIDGINRTSRCILPAKSLLLLDSALDEGTLALRRVKKEIFPPCTPVEIVITNTVIQQGKVLSQQSKTLYYVIAGDAVEESPVGGGLYNHTIALVEPTKLAELIVCDTITVTNDIGWNYTKNQEAAPQAITHEENVYKQNWNLDLC